MILTIILSIALDTVPLRPLPVLLPRPVKSEKTKVNEKPRKENNDNRRGNRVAPVVVAC
jgi:hypothetical protein